MTDVVLDGRPVSVPPGATILEACRANGISLPTLCHMDGVSVAASCRVCLVEVKGEERPVAACARAVSPGMEVATATESLQRHRRAVVAMLFASGNHVCAFCPASGRCALQDLACDLGLDRLFAAGERPPFRVDASRPRFGFDPGRCVLCSRCVRACAELERAHTLGVFGRGAASRLATDAARWGESRSCTDCGRCADACPTGALFEKATAAQGLRSRAGRVPAPVPGPPTPGTRRRVATLWLGGCSGCHMSLLDLDGRLLDLAARMDLVYSPLVDAKEFPPDVDVCLVEGAVATGEHLGLLRSARERTGVLVALGDCAATGGVTALRDTIGGAAAVLRRSWSADTGGLPASVPALLPSVRPVGDVVAVDVRLPGCPPPPDLIHYALAELVAGRMPSLDGQLRFG